jgi:hypothetical protein
MISSRFNDFFRNLFSRAVRGEKEFDFRPWDFSEGYGLQAVRKRLQTGPALAAEGTIISLEPAFFVEGPAVSFGRRS